MPRPRPSSRKSPQVPSYTLFERRVRNSDHLYTAIRCLRCGEVSHSLDDLENKYCPFCTYLYLDITY
jgi:hypothetical protein